MKLSKNNCSRHFLTNVNKNLTAVLHFTRVFNRSFNIRFYPPSMGQNQAYLCIFRKFCFPRRAKQLFPKISVISSLYEVQSRDLVSRKFLFLPFLISRYSITQITLISLWKFAKFVSTENWERVEGCTFLDKRDDNLHV